MLRFRLSFAILWIALCVGVDVSAQGVLTGDSGGNEREVSVFDRNSGQVWKTVTGVTGRFRSKPLAAGEYLAVSGSVFTPVRIEDGKATELLFSGQAGMSADTETWSPARRKFGQTFRAVGPSVDSFRFWNPGKPIDLVTELRESGPSGRLIARRELEAVNWIRIVDIPPGEWPTVRGRTYYLALASVDRSPFRIGMPALGDVYPHGRAYYDDRPVLDSDLGISIRQDNDSLRTMVRVTLHEGLGFRDKGPAAGSPTWAAQSFVAQAANLRTAWINAGWPSAEGATKRFVFSVHEDSPEGTQVGPERTVTMIKDWGATAVWFADQVPLRRGGRYAVKIRREDGQPFYAYLAPDRYAHGRAYRAGVDSEGMDLT
ncbi:MAG: carboxypeptidase-like regulatory domain-containing protein [Planctomycetota bacterium]